MAIPALEALGYETPDARDYAMAACWEFIIPGKGMEIPNIGAVPLAGTVDAAIREHLADCAGMDDLKSRIRSDLFAQVREIIAERGRPVRHPGAVSVAVLRGLRRDGAGHLAGLQVQQLGPARHGSRAGGGHARRGGAGRL